MIRLVLAMAALLLTFFALAACGEDADEPSVSLPTPTLAPTATSMPAPTATPMPAPTATPVPTATPMPAPTATPEPTATATPDAGQGEPSAAQIVAGALNAMNGADSYHFLIDVGIEVEQEGVTLELPFTFEGDFQAPDRLRGTMELSLGFFTVETEVVLIEGVYYMRNLETGEWERDSELVDALPADIAIFAMPLSIESGILAPELVGVEELDGRPSYRVRIVIADVAQGIGEDAQADLWIDVEDNTLRKMVTETAISDDGSLGVAEGSLLSGDVTITVTALISDYGVPVDIQTPQVP